MKSQTTSFYRYLPVSRRDERWGLYANTAGESWIAPGANYPPDGHPEGFAFDWPRGRVLDSFQLVYISSGRGQFETKGGGATRIEPGHAFLLFPGVWHRYAPDRETGWHEHWIGFDGPMPRAWRDNRFLGPRKALVKINAEETMRASFSHIIQSIRANRPALQQILAGATAHLLGLYYSSQQTPVSAEAPAASAIEAAINHIQSDFRLPLDIPGLARELGLGYSAFRKAFAVHTGLGPHQYLLELRLLRARNLLEQTTFSVKEIAALAGFADEHYFSRLFRRKMKLAPTQWRERSRRGGN
jgi:AraC-like DNA-binding protein